MKRFKLSTEVLFSEDAIDALLEEKDENAVLITDKFMVDSGMADMILKKLSNCKEVSVFSEVVPDPPMDLIERGIAFLQDKDCDIVVALGGGSSIDAAKAIVYMAKKIEEKQNPDNQKKIKLIALPTTSGTGSEVTQFAVVTDSKTGVKSPLIDESLMPDIAILDPELVKSAPPFITADTGLDVITHALEAYVSETASDCSDCLAEKAAELAFEFLPRAYRNGYDIKARDKMHRASCLAGMAFSNALLGIVHSMAHKTGAAFKNGHIIHGAANAMYLPKVIKYNSKDDTAKKRYGEIADYMGLGGSSDDEKVDLLIKYLRQMNDDLNIPHCIKNYGEGGLPAEEGIVPEDEFLEKLHDIAANAILDACTGSNPRQPSQEDMEKLLKCCYYDTEVDF